MKEALAKFGFAEFRPGQREVIEAALAGRDVLAVMPTGGGKSLCYQLPALLGDGLTLVVSPLIALMKDQVDRLRDGRVIQATEINSSLTSAETARRLRSLDRYRLVYVAPERFAVESFVKALQPLRVALFVVDEAHCVSHWGHDFRPDYLRLRKAVEEIRPRSVMALTATATSRVRHEIADRLGLRNPLVRVNSFDRPNLFFEADEPADREFRVQRLLQEVEGPVIVYVGRRKDADRMAARLRLPAYHAGLPSAARTRAQDSFLSSAVRGIVATVAFGMGIDKPDIRAVIHAAMPGSIEHYYQEAGRAGRDGAEARCILLTHRGDAELHEYFLEQRYPCEWEIRDIHRGLLNREAFPYPMTKVNAARLFLEEQGLLRLKELPPLDLGPLEERRAADEDRLHAMRLYASDHSCRRARILRYFGEAAPDRCDRCDACRDGARRRAERRVGLSIREKLMLDAAMRFRWREPPLPEGNGSEE